jgi:transcriptional regulator with XRE-family HTH domain
MTAAGELIRETRKRHGLDQQSLARRARTSQAQISRIERGEISPSVATIERLLAVMGERLELTTSPYETEPSELVPDRAKALAEAAELSYALTSIAAAARTR